MKHAHASRALAPLAVAFALASAIQAQTIELLSRGVAGAPANGPSGPATPPFPWRPITDAVATSADGRFIAYTSAATNLTPDDTNGAVRDVFVLDRATQTTELVSVWGAGLQGAGAARGVAISDHGRYVAFVSSSLLPADPDPFAPGHPSKMCVSAPRQRMDLASSGGATGACNGSLAIDVLAWATQHPGALLTPLTADQSMGFQAWLHGPTCAPGGSVARELRCKRIRVTLRTARPRRCRRAGSRRRSRSR